MPRATSHAPAPPHRRVAGSQGRAKTSARANCSRSAARSASALRAAAPRRSLRCVHAMCASAGSQGAAAVASAKGPHASKSGGGDVGVPVGPSVTQRLYGGIAAAGTESVRLLSVLLGRRPRPQRTRLPTRCVRQAARARSARLSCRARTVLACARGGCADEAPVSRALRACTVLRLRPRRLC
jgi:hypothetical protein